jgi:valyl-tRNA synthetase
MAKGGIEFKDIEERIKKFWEENKIFLSKSFEGKKVYSIDTPPPTVSGNMHIGHAFSYSQQDFIARFRRMFEGSVYYPFGTDDNGLPTERLVEKKNNIKSKDMSRADFIKLCLKTLKEITPEFVQDWKDIGMSCDFSKIYSTIDDNSRRISQASFIELYKKGEIYKKSFPTIWCPECQTSIAQAELEDKEEKSLFSTLKFKCDGKDLLVATTRPEMLYACVGVFVNPKDKRYSKIVGKTAKVPLFNFEVPIIADESAQMDKGTGVLMICCYGDRFDVDAVNRCNLNPKVIMNKDGTLNIPNYEGLKVKLARKKILEDLKNANLIVEQKEITHIVNVHDKCGCGIEFVETPQWFIKILDKKEKFIEQGNKIKWYPEYMKKRYDNWVNGLEWDWSISRNRHFGIPIPVWECENCNEIILGSEKELPVDPLETKKICPKCKSKTIPESMVLDTWATSSLSPYLASNLVENKVKIPFSLRPQAHDIIRTWAFYTIVREYLKSGNVPWNEIIISGNVSLGGEKMSKSKGNGVDPRKVLNDYGADALRFWAAGSKIGADLDYQEQDLVAGKKIINKLSNATKFVFMNLENYDGKSKPKNLELIDSEFLKKVNGLVKDCSEGFLVNEYSKAKSRIEQFFWSDFCDNYLEIVKKRVYQGVGEEKLSAQYTLYNSLLTMVKLFSPIMPFICEEIYQNNFRDFEKEKSIHISSWPKTSSEVSSDLFDSFVSLLAKIRQEKTNSQKAMNSEINLSLDKEELEKFSDLIDDLKNVTNAKEIKKGKFSVEFI